MNELKVTEQYNQLLISSVDVSKVVDKEHKELLRDIRRQSDYLNEGRIALVDFFIESQYEDKKGEYRPCYLLTQKGCEYIANKMTGEKGALFTAKYIDVFHEMQNQLKPSYMIDDPIVRAEKWIKEQKQHQEAMKTIEYKEDIIIGLTKGIDLTEKQSRINDIVRHTPNHNRIRERWRLLYNEFDKVYHINSKVRYENKIKNGLKCNNRLTYICKEMGMTIELYRTCVKLFEADAKAMFKNIMDLI